MNKDQQRILIISGPTGVGKSDLACDLAIRTNGEIINADMGQMYTPFTIGTAKPDYNSSPVRHHLFDIINEPRYYSVIEYRAQLLLLINQLWASGKLPIIVGGSVFYIQSLLFPPATACSRNPHGLKNQDASWEKLHEIDPERAASIHPNDLYRIQRAIEIWASTGQKPSSYKQSYNPLARSMILWVTRDQEDLYERINSRVTIMMKQGWVDECQQLLETPWQSFIDKKKLIGYNEIFNCLKGQESLSDTVTLIQQKTRAYAKRQETFWRMLKKQILMIKNPVPPFLIDTLNLTHQDSTLYSKQLLDQLYEF